MKREDLERAIIEPRRGRDEHSIPPAVMMAFTDSDLGLIRGALNLPGQPSRRIDFSNLWICPEPFEGVGVCGPALGAPASVLLLERLLALGARWIISVGSCGAIQPSLRIGQLVLVTGAISEEGTSAHYGCHGDEMVPDPGLLDSIRRVLVQMDLQAEQGRVWTTDAPFRETVGKVIRYAKEGVLAVDMECSALMCVASYRGAALASLLVVSDELGELRWRRGFHSRDFHDSMVTAAKVGASVLYETMQSFRNG